MTYFLTVQFVGFCCFICPGEAGTSTTTTMRTIENRNKKTNSAAPAYSDTPKQSSDSKFVSFWNFFVFQSFSQLLKSKV